MYRLWLHGLHGPWCLQKVAKQCIGYDYMVYMDLDVWKKVAKQCIGYDYMVYMDLDVWKKVAKFNHSFTDFLI